MTDNSQAQVLLPQGDHQEVGFATAVHRHQLLTGASVGLVGKELTEHCAHPIPNPNPRTLPLLSWPPASPGQPPQGFCMLLPTPPPKDSKLPSLSWVLLSLCFHLLDSSIPHSCFLKQVRCLIMVIWLEPGSGSTSSF